MQEQITIGKYTLVQVSLWVCEVRCPDGEICVYSTIHEAIRKRCEWDEDYIVPTKNPPVVYNLSAVDTAGKSIFEIIDMCKAGLVPIKN